MQFHVLNANQITTTTKKYFEHLKSGIESKLYINIISAISSFNAVNTNFPRGSTKITINNTSTLCSHYCLFHYKDDTQLPPGMSLYSHFIDLIVILYKFLRKGFASLVLLQLYEGQFHDCCQQSFFLFFLFQQF